MTKKLCGVCKIGWFSIKVTLRSKEVVDLVKFSVFHLIFPKLFKSILKVSKRLMLVKSRCLFLGCHMQKKSLMNLL